MTNRFKNMKPAFFKKLVILGKNNSISENDSVEFSAIKLIDLKIEDKQDFRLDLKRVRFTDIQAFENFAAESALVSFDLEEWEEILLKMDVRTEDLLDLKAAAKILLPRLRDFKIETVAEYFNLDPSFSAKEAEVVYRSVAFFHL